MKCNRCRKWAHWKCTSLGENGRWDTTFRAKCCLEEESIQEEEVAVQNSARSSKRDKRWVQWKRRRERRQEKRDERCKEKERRIGGQANTTVWTWKIERARVDFPHRNRFTEIQKVIAKSSIEVVLFSELFETTRGFKWIKAGNLYCVLVHWEKSGVFLRDKWAVEWCEQGCKRQWRNRSTALDVNGVRFVSTYQPVWNGQTQEFTEYREELEDMMMSRDRLVIGGGLYCQRWRHTREKCGQGGWCVWAE